MNILQKTTQFIRRSPLETGAAVLAAVAVILGAYTYMVVQAAGPYAYSDASQATVAGSAQLVADSTAINGKTLQFGAATPVPPPTNPTPPPTGGTGSCALPAYPKPSCTGVPAGTTLTQVNGDVTLSAGQTLSGKRVTGNVIIDGDGVVIKNSEIYGIVRGDPTNPPSYTITDSTVGPVSGCNGDAALAFANYTATRVRIRNFGDGPRDSGNNILIQDSFVQTCSNPGDHSDGFQAYLGGSNVRVIHNTIDARPSAPDVTSAIFDSESQGITAQNNLLLGGGFTVHIDSSTKSTFSGNQIAKDAWIFGPVYPGLCSGVTWSNNQLVNVDSNFNVTSVVSALPCS